MSNLAKQLVEQGNASMRSGRYQDALSKYQSALRLVPNHPGILSNCAVILERLNRLEEALANYDQVRRAAPPHPGILNNCGVVLNKLNRLPEALEMFDKALSLKPDFAEALNNRGNVLLKLRRPAEALKSYDRALAARPDHADTLYNRATCLHNLKRYKEAVDCLLAALKVAPDFAAARESLLYNRLNCCDWTDHEASCAAVIASIEAGQKSCDPFFFTSIARSPVAQLICARTFAQAEYGDATAALPWREDRREDRGERINIAYVSADFREHTGAHLMASVFEDHDRSRFHVTAISLGPGDGSEMRARLLRAFDSFVDVHGKNDRDVVDLMRKMNIDIAVNLSGYTAGHRTHIFAYRAAPIQVSFMAYSATMGAPFIDYILTDRHILPPRLEPTYTEIPARLPDCYMPSDRQKTIPGPKPTREQVGLPAAGFVFCAFNASYKLRPDMFAVWMRLLRNIDGSVLWLREENPTSTANLRAAAAAHGIDPDRLVFAARVSMDLHMARQMQADLFLDTFPYGGHTMVIDALWAGLPVLTLVGETFVSRVASSMLQTVGLPELITTSVEDYEALAQHLATHPVELAALRARLEVRRTTSPLFDMQRMTRHIERAFEGMVARHRRGEKPAPFDVAPLDVEPLPESKVL